MDGSPDILRRVDVDVDVSTTVGSGVRTTGEASTPGSSRDRPSARRQPAYLRSRMRLRLPWLSVSVYSTSRSPCWITRTSTAHRRNTLLLRRAEQSDRADQVALRVVPREHGDDRERRVDGEVLPAVEGPSGVHLRPRGARGQVHLTRPGPGLDHGRDEQVSAEE